MNKEELQSLTEEELKEEFNECDYRIHNIMLLYGYSEMQWSVIRTAASGEMGNMFVCMRQYNLTAAEYGKIARDMKTANLEHFRIFCAAAGDWSRAQKEQLRRYWEQKAREKAKRDADTVDGTVL